MPGFHKAGEGWGAAGRVGKLAPMPCPYAMLHSPWHHPLYLWLVINSFHLVLEANPTSWLHSGISFLGWSLASLHMCSYYWNVILHSRMLGSKLAFCSVGWLGGVEDNYPSPKIVFSLAAWRDSLATLNTEDEKQGRLGEPIDFPKHQHILSLHLAVLGVVTFCVVLVRNHMLDCGLLRDGSNYWWLEVCVWGGEGQRERGRERERERRKEREKPDLHHREVYFSDSSWLWNSRSI